MTVSTNWDQSPDATAPNGAAVSDDMSNKGAICGYSDHIVTSFKLKHRDRQRDLLA